MDPADPPTHLPEELEAAVYDIFFQTPGTAQEEALDRLCARHAEHAAELRRLAGLVRSGARTLGGDTELEGLRPGSEIGPYHILQKIGEGGFGAVFLAEQREPIERQVALKVLLPGMDSRQILLRFEAERRALARLDHPNVARVLDAGKTDKRHPYFVMEYVPGIPITRYCDEHRLPLHQRLQLFLQVCSGVQHSHQKGIIHRDLKPTNLLVTLAEGGPRTKIIDFGVAKALTRPLTETTLHTEIGRLLGTPEYMSPEQAEMSPLDVDTRSDIYSLGVLLYELLTGCLPFDSDALRSKGFAEVRRLLRDVDPPSPSRKLAGDPGAATRAAERSGTTAQALSDMLRGDLDWVVQKAMDKDRTRRYATVGELADDLRRFLDDQTVQARPPSASYRLRKLYRRHRGEFVGVSVALVALVVGLVASLLLYLDSEASARLARQREGEAKDNAAQAQRNLETAQRNAEDARRNLETAERNAEESRRNAERAQRNAERAELAVAQARSNLADYERLSDLVLLDRFVAEAERELWPELPDRLPRIEAWLDEARKLIARLPIHRRTLDELVAAREPDSDAQTPRFADERRQFLHDNLARLVGGLEGFAGAQGRIAAVERRRDWAASIVRRTVEDHQARWVQVREELAKDPRFEGFTLAPQVGLVPLGADPDSGLQEFAHLRTGEVPVRGEDRHLRFTEKTGLVFVLVPGGSFWMGAQAVDPEGRNYDPEAVETEGPVNEVRLAPFLLSKYEMSQAQWERFAGANPALYKAGTVAGGVEMSAANPVESVSWGDCDLVLGRMGLLLPTEAQWEYAARAGSDTPWPTGKERLSLQGHANISDEETYKNGYLPRGASYEKGFVDGYSCHAPVDALLPNAFGLHQMVGNVAEWCREDLAGYDVTPREADGLRQPPRPSQIRAMRGGAYAGNASFGRSALRARAPAHFRSSNLGVRPSRAID